MTGTIREVFERYDVGPVLPAEGYSPAQLEELRAAIDATPCDTVVLGTPMDLRHVIDIEKPAVAVTYELVEAGGPALRDLVAPVVDKVRS